MIGDKLCQWTCSYRSPYGYCGKTGECVFFNATQRIQSETQRVENVGDMVAVIRCKDCKYWKLSLYNTVGIHICTKFSGVRGEHDFCSRGERKDGADE